MLGIHVLETLPEGLGTVLRHPVWRPTEQRRTILQGTPVATGSERTATSCTGCRSGNSPATFLPSVPSIHTGRDKGACVDVECGRPGVSSNVNAGARRRLLEPPRRFYIEITARVVPFGLDLAALLKQLCERCCASLRHRLCAATDPVK
jgi:hypothetical protein